MNNSFSKPVKNLKVPAFDEVNPFAEKTPQTILKEIFEYSRHSSFIAINNVTNGLTFQFSYISIDDAFKEIKKKLHSNKILEYSLKQNADAIFWRKISKYQPNKTS